MNKEYFEKRSLEINQALSKARAQVLKLEGHLSECHHMLATIYKDEMEQADKLSCPPKADETPEPCKEQEDGNTELEDQSETS